MKKLITPTLIQFIITISLLTVLFRYALSASITSQSDVVILLVAIVYFVLMFYSGAYFGRKEYVYLPILDVGFRFHLFTYLIFNTISVLWFVFNLQSKYEHINTVFIMAAIWAVFLLTHFVYYLYARRSSINNLDKEDLFE